MRFYSIINGINGKLLYSLSYVLTLIFSLVSVYVLSRNLSVEEYGQYYLFITISYFLSSIISLSAYRLIPFAKAQTETRKEYESFLANAIFITSLNALIALLLLVSIESLIEIPKTYIPLIVAFSLFISLGNFLRSSLDYDNRITLSCIISIVESVMNLILPITFIYIFNNHKLLSLLIAVTLSSLIVLSVYLISIRLALHIDLKYIKLLLKKGSPILPHILSGQLLIYSDRWMIAKFYNETDVALYSAPYNLANIVNAVTVALSRYYIPLITENITKDRFHDSCSQIARFSTDMMLITLAITLSGPGIYCTLLPMTYWPGIGVLPPLILSMYVVFIYSIFFNIEVTFGRTTFSMWSTSIAALLNIILNIIYLPTHGYQFAAWITLLSYIVLLVLHLSYVLISMKFIYIPTYTLFSHFIIICFVNLCFKFFLNNDFARAIGIIIGTIIGLIVLLKWLREREIRKVIAS